MKELTNNELFHLLKTRVDDFAFNSRMSQIKKAAKVISAADLDGIIEVIKELRHRT